MFLSYRLHKVKGECHTGSHTHWHVQSNIYCASFFIGRYKYNLPHHLSQVSWPKWTNLKEDLGYIKLDKFCWISWSWFQEEANFLIFNALHLLFTVLINQLKFVKQDTFLCETQMPPATTKSKSRNPTCWPRSWDMWCQWSVGNL